jgi:hypothetical protein
VSAHLEAEELEALALGELEPERAAQVAGHAAQCAECGRELGWARVERALIVRRAAATKPAAALWAGIAARIEATPPAPRLRRPHWARRLLVGAAGASAAAAVLILALRPGPHVGPRFSAPDASVEEVEPGPDSKSLAALDRAETDYQKAATLLEAEYAASRGKLDPALAKRWDETLSKARAQLGDARTVAAQNVNARMRLLSGYAGYLRSLRSVVEESEEGNP